MIFRHSPLLTLSLIVCLSTLGTVLSQEASTQSVEYMGKFTPIVNLTEITFDDYALNSNLGSWFIMFYSPGCKLCKQVTPELIEFSKKFYGKINVAVVDCDANSYLRKRLFINGYPTFVYFRKNKMYHYHGPSTMEGWEKFIAGGYKEVEAEEVLSQASSIDAAFRGLRKVLHHLKIVMRENPLIPIGILSFVIVMVFISFKCAFWIHDKFQNEEEEARKQDSGSSEALIGDKKVKKE